VNIVGFAYCEILYIAAALYPPSILMVKGRLTVMRSCVVCDWQGAGDKVTK